MFNFTDTLFISPFFLPFMLPISSRWGQIPVGWCNGIEETRTQKPVFHPKHHLPQCPTLHHLVCWQRNHVVGWEQRAVGQVPHTRHANFGQQRNSNVIKYAHAVKPISCPRRLRFTSGGHVEKENRRVFLLCQASNSLPLALQLGNSLVYSLQSCFEYKLSWNYRGGHSLLAIFLAYIYERRNHIQV